MCNYIYYCLTYFVDFSYYYMYFNINSYNTTARDNTTRGETTLHEGGQHYTKGDNTTRGETTLHEGRQHYTRGATLHHYTGTFRLLFARIEISSERVTIIMTGRLVQHYTLIVRLRLIDDQEERLNL